MDICMNSIISIFLYIYIHRLNIWPNCRTIFFGGLNFGYFPNTMFDIFWPVNRRAAKDIICHFSAIWVVCVVPWPGRGGIEWYRDALSFPVQFPACSEHSQRGFLNGGAPNHPSSTSIATHGFWGPPILRNPESSELTEHWKNGLNLAEGTAVKKVIYGYPICRQTHLKMLKVSWLPCFCEHIFSSAFQWALGVPAAVAGSKKISKGS